MVRAVVIGGAGFIGSHIVEELLQQTVEVTVYDNFQSGSIQNLGTSLPHIQLIESDIRNTDELAFALKGADWVFHLAALTSPFQSIEDPLLTYDINVYGTLNVLWESLKAGVSRVVISSSCAIYGSTHYPPLKETYSGKPMSPYGASKLAVEALADSFYHSYNLETLCLRYFNVYGKRQKSNSDYAAVIPKFIECYLKKQSPQIYGDGTQSRDFIYVADVARANIVGASLASDILKDHRAFNIGTGTETNLLELLEIISHQMGYYLPPEFHESKVGDIYNSYADMSLSKENLGFSPSIILEDGIKELCNYTR